MATAAGAGRGRALGRADRMGGRDRKQTQTRRGSEARSPAPGWGRGWGARPARRHAGTPLGGGAAGPAGPAGQGCLDLRALAEGAEEGRRPEGLSVRPSTASSASAAAPMRPTSARDSARADTRWCRASACFSPACLNGKHSRQAAWRPGGVPGVVAVRSSTRCLAMHAATLLRGSCHPPARPDRPPALSRGFTLLPPRR